MNHWHMFTSILAMKHVICPVAPACIKYIAMQTVCVGSTMTAAIPPYLFITQIINMRSTIIPQEVRSGAF